MAFPIALNLQGRRCLVLGTSDESRARARALLERGALVRWVLNESSDASLEQAASPPGLEVVYGPFLPAHLDGVWLAVLGDRDSALALALQELCERRCVWFCAIDQPTFNSFSHMSVLDLDPLQLAIGSDGQAPALVRRLRQELLNLLGAQRTRTFFERIAQLRRATPPAERRAALERALQGFSIEGRVNLPDQSERD